MDRDDTNSLLPGVKQGKQSNQQLFLKPVNNASRSVAGIPLRPV